MQVSEPLLAELAGSYGVLPSYRDSRGGWRESSTRSIYQALAALGADVDPEMADEPGGAGVSERRRRLERAIQTRRDVLWTRLVEPVLVCWDGTLDSLVVRIPQSGPSRLELNLIREDGEETRWHADRDSLQLLGEERVGRRRYAAFRLKGPGTSQRAARLPLGYHRLLVSCGTASAEATIISAPQRSYRPRASEGQEWGLFAPLYALRSERDWGAGDLAELERLLAWVIEAGGSVVATLPLLSTYLDRPFEPAPYRPVSRLFWNEFYLAPEIIPEWQACHIARDLCASDETRMLIADLRKETLTDYRRVMALKRRVLEELSRCFFSRGDDRRMASFAEYLHTHPEAERYAAFRARVEAAGTEWREWGDRAPVAGDGSRLSRAPAEFSGPERYHLYCQWQMDEQLRGLSRSATSSGSFRPAGLMLDVPVGVHPGGFDTWRWQDLFVSEMSIGAPPDSFFSKGQNWDCPPLHPERSRQQAHRYFASCIREQMRHASYLRIDHVMSLHRLYWLPEGGNGTDGVYVTYPADELYAILSLESHRNQTVVVGEDLGTVPPEVRRAMRRHRVLGMWVFQLSLRPRADSPVSRAPRDVVASMNTHDMFPFAGFLQGDDIATRLRTGQVDLERARRETTGRGRLIDRLEMSLPDGVPPSTGLLSRAITGMVASHPAMLLLSLEDLLRETRPQNLPGTGAEQANWRRRILADDRRLRSVIREAARLVGRG